MNFIVLDLEWNQSPTGKAGEIEQLPFEIIEIGAVRVNENHEITDRFCEIIRPQVYTTLHFRTKEIVSLRSVDLIHARTFPEVIRDFFRWCGSDSHFCTWGPADLLELQRNLAYHKIKNPFPFPLFYYDIQKIFSIVYEDRKTRRALEYAVDYLDLSKRVPFHSALSDAWYTSLVMKYLTTSQILENSSIDYFRTPKYRRQEIYIKYSTYSKFVSKSYDSKMQTMKDHFITSVTCPECQKKAARIQYWFSASAGRNYYGIYHCDTHGYLKGKLRLRHTSDGHYFAIKTIKPVSYEEAQQIIDKKAAHSSENKTFPLK